MNLVSIIVPVYNVEAYLRRCIESILKQTYTSFELILVDDGSTDDSGRICDEYQKKDERIIVIHQENKGLSEARNSGIDICNGQYIVFVDSDDSLCTTMVEKLYYAITNDNAEISLCSINCIADNQTVDIERFENDYNPLKNEVISGRDVLIKKMNERKSWVWIVAWNKMYRRELFDNIRYPKGKIHEDEYVIHKLMLKCDKVVSIPEKLYNYYIRKGSITGSKLSIKRLDYVSVLFERACDYSFDTELKSLSIKMLKEGVREFRKYYYNVGRKKDKLHKRRNKEIQLEYRKAYNAIRKSKRKLELYYFENFFSLYRVWEIYIIRKKILRLLKR